MRGDVEHVDMNAPTIPGRVFYFPHSMVKKEDADGTVKLASCSMRPPRPEERAGRGCPALNNLLLKGRNKNTDLVKLLLAFRKEPIALAGDISKMFTRVQLNREDRDVCRFLWRHMETWRQPTVYMHSKISFGRTDASFSAVEVLHTEAERRQDDLPEASKMVREATWTDDTLGSVADVETAIRMRKEIQEIGEGASMEYRKWISNSKRGHAVGAQGAALDGERALH